MGEASSADADRNDDLVIEGMLFKKRLGIIQGGWNSRFFRLYSNNRLVYYRKEDDETERGSFTLGPTCTVGDLFVEKIHRKMAYCVKIELSPNTTATESDRTLFSDDSSQQPSEGSVENDPPVTAAAQGHETPSTPLRKMFRRQRSDGAVSSQNDINNDGNNSPTTPRSMKHARTWHSHDKLRLRRNLTGGDIPQTVRLPPATPFNNSNHGGTTTTNNNGGGESNNNSNDENDDEIDYLRSEYLISQQMHKQKAHEKIVHTTQLVAAAGATIGVAVVTAGVGLMAGAIALGVAAGAGGGAVATSSTFRTIKTTRSLVIASADYEVAKRWHTVLAAALESENIQRCSTWGRQWFGKDDRKARAALLPSESNDSNNHHHHHHRSSAPTVIGDASKWTVLGGGLLTMVLGGFQGLRVFRETDEVVHDYNRQSIVSSKAFKSTALKAQVVLETTPLDAFLCFMTQFETIVETFDMHTDVIHVKAKPIYLFPSWTSPRDFCLYRYWRLEQDGSYVICFESIEHERCPPSPDFVRAEMHAVYSIQPPARRRRRGRPQPLNQCMMTATVQLDPKGWIPTYPFCNNQSYSDAFSVDALMRLLDVRDTIDRDRFVAYTGQTGFNAGGESALPHHDISRSMSNETTDDNCHEDGLNYDFAYAGNENSPSDEMSGYAMTAFSTCPPALARRFWAEPDSNSFRVRGANYKEDRLKQNAGQSIGRLVAVDIVTVDESIYTGFSMHPTERIQLALKREREAKANGTVSDMPPFVFLVNIVIPGPPFYHMVFYFAVDDIRTINGADGSPSSKLCQRFLFGDSDEFRDATFKLIPQVVQGNFIVRKAVGSTPAIMGKKLRQLYVRNERFMEVILDCGSSPVATGVIRLSFGYAKTQVTDMGFVLEGDEPEFLPERIFGCVRIKHIELTGQHIRHVLAPPSPPSPA